MKVLKNIDGIDELKGAEVDLKMMVCEAKHERARSIDDSLIASLLSIKHVITGDCRINSGTSLFFPFEMSRAWVSKVRVGIFSDF